MDKRQNAILRRNKTIKMKKYILPVILILILLWLAFDKVSNVGLTEEFKAKQDSLVHAVDSLVEDNEQKDLVIFALEEVDHNMQLELQQAKGKIVKVKEIVYVEQEKINSYSDAELISSFNNRYPTDTITNPLPVAQPVLVSAAKDLVELDGAKQQLTIQDTIISGLESRVVLKDSVISLYVSKEANYKNIMNNQQTQIKDWKFQYNTLQLENTKLKAKNKFTKIGAGLVAGGLVYLMLAK